MKIALCLLLLVAVASAQYRGSLFSSRRMSGLTRSQGYLVDGVYCTNDVYGKVCRLMNAPYGSFGTPVTQYSRQGLNGINTIYYRR